MNHSQSGAEYPQRERISRLSAVKINIGITNTIKNGRGCGQPAAQCAILNSAMVFRYVDFADRSVIGKTIGTPVLAAGTRVRRDT